MQVKKLLFNSAKFLFFLSIGGFFIWIFVKKLTPEQINEIFDAFSRVDYFWLVLAFVAGLISHISRAYRWRMLLNTMGYAPAIKNVIGAVFVGYIANLAIPRLGEMTRCGILTRYEKIPFNKSFGTVVTERVFDLICFAIVMTIALAYEFGRLIQLFDELVWNPLMGKLMAGELNMLWVLLAIVLGMLLFFFLIKKLWRPLHDKVWKFAHGFLEGLKSLVYIKNPLLFIAHTFLIWTMYYVMTYVGLICLAESANLPFSAGMAALAFGSIGIMIVQGGIGIYPVIIAKTLALYGISQTIGYALGWVSWTTQTILLVFIGTAALLLLPYLNQKKNG